MIGGALKWLFILTCSAIPTGITTYIGVNVDDPNSEAIRERIKQVELEIARIEEKKNEYTKLMGELEKSVTEVDTWLGKFKQEVTNDVVNGLSHVLTSLNKHLESLVQEVRKKQGATDTTSQK